MIFLWTATKRGKIWLDSEPFKALVSRRLPQDFYCQDVSFVGDQNLLNVYITLPEKEDPQARLVLMDKLEAFFRPMGIAVHTHWTHRSPTEERERLRWTASPLFWAGVVGGVVALTQMGLVGVLWTAFSTAAAYGIAWLALSEGGRRIIDSVVKEIRRN